jgi:molecular chaperone GrpE
MADDQQQKQDEVVADSAAGVQAGTASTGEGAGEDLELRIQEAVNAALAEQREQVLRAHAEVQNMRRRCESDVEKAHKFALEKFSGELLSVVDNLERALAAVPEGSSEQVRSLCEGVELTLKSFLEVFSKFNLQQIDPVGEPFDPQFHQAITMVVNPAVEPNTVIAVMQKGYALHGRVIRPAMVVVAKAG